ncbi:tyrosine-type recombinase/integrase [Nonomuraea recticatena]|uniref:Tyrosine-type recombinase/integrase n=1 Tax=Nonomuraea recticatena TaxID=46178 RepID=A0ABP6E4N7_9ACTN
MTAAAHASGLPPELVGDRLRRLLDGAFLAEIGWEEETGLLRPPPEHPLLGWNQCTVSGCAVDATAPGWMCTGCRARWPASGLSRAQFEADPPPKVSGFAYKWLIDERLCGVLGCQRPLAWRAKELCNTHLRRCREVCPVLDEEAVAAFMRRPDVHGLPGYGPCQVAACLRVACNADRLCLMHARRWAERKESAAGQAHERWCRTDPGITVSGVVNLRGLAPLVVTELLASLQQRAARGVKTRYSAVHLLARELRSQQAATVFALNGSALSHHVSVLWNSCKLEIVRATTTPEEEQRKDIWDLAVLGRRGRLDFTEISQPWLREITKRWAAEDLPRRRGEASGRVVADYIHSLAELSAVLRVSRPDAGVDPTTVGRPDIVQLLNRLAHQASIGELSSVRHARVLRHTRTVLRQARDLGLTRPGQCAAGLAGEFAIRAGEIPKTDYLSGPGRALPAEVMTALDAALPLLEAASGRTVRVAVELLMDTGRRPDEVCRLPWNCLDRDGDGKYVLVYDDFKEDRLGRRLPISDACAQLVRAQQAAVRAAFPSTDEQKLALFPAVTRNPDGTRSLRGAVLTGIHRAWVDALPPFVLADGGFFPHSEVVAYAYRHSYAQRHADVGTPIDVLRELMGHRTAHSTQGYYRITEKRSRAAVERVTAHQFDGSGQRIWRQAAALLDSERARMRIGQVSVPYGTCVEPSNVQAGGGACPYRFRCLGCGHFRTDVSYLPELRAHLDQLLADRERVLATSDLQDWARAEATPSDIEINKMRTLIRRVEDHLDELPEQERQQLRDATKVLRSARQTVNLGMPAIRAANVREIGRTS